jgi:hypothetical protein
MSRRPPLTRGKPGPRWSNSGRFGARGSPPLMAGLPACGNMVWVGPPLVASGAGRGAQGRHSAKCRMQNEELEVAPDRAQGVRHTERRLHRHSFAFALARSYHNGMKRRYLVWLLVLALVFGFGWYKSAENRRELEAQAAWRERIAGLEAESQTRYEDLRTWAANLSSDPDPARQIAEKLNGGRALVPVVQGTEETLKCELHHLGIELEFHLSGGRLIGHSMRRSSGLIQAANPQPGLFAHEGPAESVRRWIPTFAIVLWLVALPVAILWRRWGLVAAEAMLVLVLACGTAWLVSPNYDLTPRGIFSNDVLFYAVIGYLVSLFILSWRLAGDPERPRKLQFTLRTLLAVTTLAAILSAAGALGYVALASLGAGAIFVWLTFQIGPLRGSSARASATST